MKLDRLLERASRSNGTLTVRCGLAAPIVKNFPELVTDIRRLQNCLRLLPLLPGHVVGLHASGTYECIVWNLALIDMRVIPQIFPEDWRLTAVQAAAKKHRMAFVVSQHDGSMLLSASEDCLLPPHMKISPDAARSLDDDLLAQVYSSGTSGSLKGLHITRSGTQDLAAQFIESFAVTELDRYLLFLPLSHFQQFLSVYVCLYVGVSLMLTSHTQVFHDLPKFRPTFLIAPPAFYETAVAILIPRDATDPARRLQIGFGGRIRFMITGMAPIRRSVLKVFEDQQLPLLEAYGITEVGLVAWNTPGDNRVGTVGRPLQCHEVVLGKDSEIMVRARHALSAGYFEAGADDGTQIFRADGYIATGDIGEFRDGRLVLTGRKKDIIITNGGVKVHPSQLEAQILAYEVVRQTVVACGPRNEGEVVAVVSVDDPYCDSTIAIVDGAIGHVNGSLTGQVRISRTILTKTRFTPENGLLTRNMKPNRAAISRHFFTPEIYDETPH